MDAMPSVGVQRRHSERRPHKVEITLLGKSAGLEYKEPAHTVDLSDEGLGILTDNPVDAARHLDPGQILYVSGIGDSRHGYYRVVWTRAEHEQAPTWAGLKYIN
ncbi:MAG: PilZ domain-containing protein [Acidobacteria bacterium]|nr:PilZ domain-containing protein [Acidobacteriota bacterium]